MQRQLLRLGSYSELEGQLLQPKVVMKFGERQ